MKAFTLKFLSLLIVAAGLTACGYYPYEYYEEEIIIDEYDYRDNYWEDDWGRDWTFVVESYWDEPYGEDYSEGDFALELLTPNDHSLIFENEFVDGCVHVGTELLPAGKREDYITCQMAPSGTYEVRLNNWSWVDRDVRLVIRFPDDQDWLTGESDIHRRYFVEANSTVVSPLILGAY